MDSVKEEVAFVKGGWRQQLAILTLGLGTILVWRGIWTLSDNIILKDDPITSSLVTIFLGLLLFVFIGEIKI